MEWLGKVVLTRSNTRWPFGASVQTPILKLQSSVIVLVALYERRLQVCEIRVQRESYNLMCRTYHT
jgi:hypothetical protein